MPPPTPLHASERKLGWFMLAAIPLAVGVMVFLFGLDWLQWIVITLRDWVVWQWDRVLHGARPELTLRNFLSLLLVSLPVGAVFLVPWHLLHLVGRRRTFWPEAVWLWSGLYGLAAAGLGVAHVLLVIAEEGMRAGVDLRFLVFIASELALGLVIAVPAFRAWRRRRRERRAALAADTTANPALQE